MSRRDPFGSSAPGLISFDATGTLFRTDSVPRVYSEVLNRHGIELDEAVVAKLFPIVWRELDCSVPAGIDRFASHAGGAKGFWRRLLERLCELADAPAPSRFAASELFERFAKAECWEVYPEVKGTLEQLRRDGYLLIVLSNWDERLPRLLAELELDRAFEAVIHSSAVGIAKPSPEIFDLAAKRVGRSANRMLHVGDSHREDVEGAVAAGAAAVLVDRQQRSSQPASPSVQTVASLDALPELLTTEYRG